MLNQRLDVVFFFEDLWAAGNETIKVVNYIADVVGNSARRIRGMGAALEDYDV
jgi:hypothetical protein